MVPVTNGDGMEDERQRSPLYKVIGFACAGLIVALAAGLVVVYGPSLRQATPTEGLTRTLAEHFPGSAPEVTRPGPDSLRVVLKVSFDPTVDAEQAQDVFQRTREVVRAQETEGLHSLEVELQGVSLDGGATTASRSFEVTGTAK